MPSQWLNAILECGCKQIGEEHGEPPPSDLDFLREVGVVSRGILVVLISLVLSLLLDLLFGLLLGLLLGLLDLLGLLNLLDLLDLLGLLGLLLRLYRIGDMSADEIR